jgi:hypothetical protein
MSVYDVVHQRRERTRLQPPENSGSEAFAVSFSFTAANEQRGGYRISSWTAVRHGLEFFDEDDGENQATGPETVPVRRRKAARGLVHHVFILLYACLKLYCILFRRSRFP